MNTTATRPRNNAATGLRRHVSNARAAAELSRAALRGLLTSTTVTQPIAAVSPRANAARPADSWVNSATATQSPATVGHRRGWRTIKDASKIADRTTARNIARRVPTAARTYGATSEYPAGWNPPYQENR